MSLRLSVYRLIERFGMHVTPTGARRKGYYSPLPNVGELEASISEWAHPSQMPGVDTTLESQMQWLAETVKPFQSEVTPHAAYAEAWQLRVGADGYGPVEAHVHHCVLRRYQPERMVEIGSGVSTVVARRALQSASLTAIEPFPTEALRRFCQENRINLIEQPAQRAALQAAQTLNAGDVLFIDSSHAVKPAADAPYLVTEIIPRLRPGVIIHVHDIHFPYGYQPNALTSPFIWAETWLWWALLIQNPHLQLLASLSWLHYEQSEQLVEFFPDYSPRKMINGLFPEQQEGTHYPSSLWLVTR